MNAQQLLEYLLQLKKTTDLTKLDLVDTSFSEIRQIKVETDTWTSNEPVIRLSIIEDK